LIFQKIVRQTIRDIGYTRAKYGFDGDTCSVLTSIDEQSKDIDQGVSKSLEVKEAEEEKNRYGNYWAGDQGMMFGYAVDETKELMPLPISLAHKLTQRLSEVRKKKLVDYLRPDGKSQVTIEYEDAKPKRVEAVVISAHHDKRVKMSQIKRDIKKLVIDYIIPKKMMDKNTKIFINPTGRFEVGGPQGDTGITGRKIIVDTYGGFGRHGGGAFSGKDPSKVDRSASYMCRYIAKNIVAAGLAERCEIQLAYTIGKAQPVSLLVNTYATGVVSSIEMTKMVEKEFDMRPAAIIEQLDLLRPIYKKQASYGHFGRELDAFTWEKTDLIEKLKKAL